VRSRLDTDEDVISEKRYIKIVVISQCQYQLGLTKPIRGDGGSLPHISGDPRSAAVTDSPV
jgi:hypothetical protein